MWESVVHEKPLSDDTVRPGREHGTKISRKREVAVELAVMKRLSHWEHWEHWAKASNFALEPQRNSKRL